jgi:hypothetical protein
MKRDPLLFALSERVGAMPFAKVSRDITPPRSA